MTTTIKVAEEDLDRLLPLSPKGDMCCLSTPLSAHISKDKDEALKMLMHATSIVLPNVRLTGHGATISQIAWVKLSGTYVILPHLPLQLFIVGFS